MILSHRQECRDPADHIWALAGLSRELAAMIPILSPAPKETEATVSAATLRGHILRACIKGSDWPWVSLLAPLTLTYHAILSQLMPVSVLSYCSLGPTPGPTNYSETILRYLKGSSSHSISVPIVLSLALGVCSLRDIAHTSTIFYESLVGKIQLLRALFDDDELGGSQIYTNTSGWVRAYQLSLMVLNQETLSAFLYLDQATRKRYIKPVSWVQVFGNATAILQSIGFHALFIFLALFVLIVTTDFTISLCICAPATVLMAIGWDSKLWRDVPRFVAPVITVVLLWVSVWWGRRRGWLLGRSRAGWKVVNFSEAHALAHWARGPEYNRWVNPRYRYNYY